MNNIINELRKYNIKATKYTLKNSVYIVESEDKKYVFKRIDNNRNTKKINNIYSYLLSRDFKYYPKLLNVFDDYEMYEYIDDVMTPDEQRAIDIINLMSLLHNKTTFYKEVSIDFVKEKYDTIKEKISESKEYYTNQISIIEDRKYMSPSEYHLARNISVIFKALDFCLYYLEKWYTIVSKKLKIRQTVIHNNLNTSHILENSIPYLISWNLSDIDIPIYDFYKFYINNYLDFNFENLYTLYNSKYPLLLEEKMLLFILLSIPKIIKFSDDEMDNCVRINRFFEYIYKTEKLIKPDTLNETSKK